MADLLEPTARAPSVHKAKDAPGRTLIGLVQSAIAQHPDREAIADGERRITYRELDAMSDRVAWAVADRLGSARREPIVALSVRPGYGTVVAILGIMKAGAAYVPIDTELPDQRLSFILDDCDAALLIDDGSRQGAHQVERLTLDDALAFETPRPLSPPDPADMAYVIYTSGSTGAPKGVVVEHHNAVYFVEGSNQKAGLTAQDRSLLFASISFDAAIWDVFAILSCGGLLVVVNQALRRDPAAVIELMARERVTCACLPPALLPKLPDHPLPHLRFLLAGGETCTPQAVARWSKDRVMANGYGPTEASVCATWGELSPDVPPSFIGKAMPGAKLYVLDENGEPAAAGTDGELYIGGAGVARGYLRRPELTAERFLTDPRFGGDRVFRTGDRVRLQADGTLLFLGRLDSQVKISGHRVEPDEVARSLERIDGVAEACVVSRGEGSARTMVAFYVPTAEPLPPHDLIEALMAWVPQVMLPATYTPLPEIPLTVSGKYDRMALVALAEAAASGGQDGDLTPTEAEIAEIWCALLNVPAVAPTDSFQALGGDSMRLAELIVILNERYGTTLMPARMRKLPDLAALAAFVDTRRKDRRTS